MSKIKVICFGEILWDMLPGGKVAGGAPMNVAFQLQNFGIDSFLVSRVGSDHLGDELMQLLKQKGIHSRFIQLDSIYPTSTVEVELDKKGHAQYEIIAPVAWDFIEMPQSVLSTASEAKAIVFGSLANRNARSRSSLLELLENSHALKLFDVNLRPPHYDRPLLEKLMAKAHIVKMNDEELAIIGEWHGDHHTEDIRMKKILDQYQLDGLIVTKGKDGAAYLDRTQRYECSAFPITIADTVGSGDAFLAAFTAKYLQGNSPQQCLEFACAAGALVATHRGGTPSITEDDVFAMIK
jgi:fructokinase